MRINSMYFLVRINRKEQANFQEHFSKDSVLYMPIANRGNSRNMEHGEIVQIGQRMHHIFENARIGDILIFDWIIESPQDQTRKSYFCYRDDTYNYYAVDESSIKGLYRDGAITPYKTFVFLKNIPAFPDDHKFEVTAAGILVFKNWKESPEDVAHKVEHIKKHIQSLAKSTRTPEIQKEMERMTREMHAMNKVLSKKATLPYRLAYSNNIADRNFGFKLKEDDILYCDNWACRFITNFKDKDYSYIICPIENIAYYYAPEPVEALGEAKMITSNSSL